MAQTFPQLPAGTSKVTIYHAVTGEAVERWPVDARGMVECGEYSLTPPERQEAAAEAQEEASADPGEEPQVAPGTPQRVHPLSTPGVAVPVVLGGAGPAAPVELPEQGAKKRGRPRKFPTE